MNNVVLRGWWVTWPGSRHASWATTSQEQEWGPEKKKKKESGPCGFLGHMCYSGPVSEMQGPDSQGRILEFTTVLNLAFQQMKELLALVGGQQEPRVGGCSPDPTWMLSFLVLQILCCASGHHWYGICCFHWGSICPHVQVQHISFPVGTTSHLLPVQTVSEGWPHMPPTWKMGGWSKSSQSHFLSSDYCGGFKDENVTQARPKAFQIMGFHGVLGKAKPFQEEWMWSGCPPGVAGGPGCSEGDCACTWMAQVLSRTDGWRGTRSLGAHEPLGLTPPTQLFSLSLLSINLFISFIIILIYLTWVSISSPL